ncbi:MAG: HAD family phosphatase [Spirochaetia bacterium]|nr:HAD family phosphatase [Spirochaetia bacterium]
MKTKAIIFDFNGTLFWDSEINYKSWYNCILRWLDVEYTLDQYVLLNGRTTYETLEKVFPRQLNKEEIEKFSIEKDQEYLKVMDSEKDKLSLAEGAEKLLTQLLKDNYKISIATSAPPSLMKEYENIFKLSRYFKDDYIISSDGTLPSKPNPAIYNKAINVLNVSPRETVVFEDSKSGIISASKANVKKIIAVNSLGSDIKTISSLKEIDYIINSYNDVSIEAFFN